MEAFWFFLGYGCFAFLFLAGMLIGIFGVGGGFLILVIFFIVLLLMVIFIDRIF